MPEFTKVDVPNGRFIGFAAKGQVVTVKVQSYDPNGATDFNGNVCPRLDGVLTEDCDNYTDLRNIPKLERLKAGELVQVTAGLTNLRRGLNAAEPKPGDLVRMSFTDTYKTANGDGKVIEVQIARAEHSVTADDV
jgi:hypothetical protein